MSDRKYRQHGYQDEPRQPRREQSAPVKKEYTPRGQPPIAPKTFSMPGFREVVKCVRCGYELTVATAWSTDGTLQALRIIAPYLRSVRELRYQRGVRVPQASAGADLTEGRPEHLRGVRAAHHG